MLLGAMLLRRRAVALLGALSLSAACARHAPTPPLAHDARFGFAPNDFDEGRACGSWSDAADGHPDALVHDAFPEASTTGCFVRVRYGEGDVTVDPVPDGCGFPNATSLDRIEQRAASYDLVASRSAAPALPMELACDLPDDVRTVAARTNARSLQSFAEARRSGSDTRVYPYALVGTFGYGAPAQDGASIARFRPGDACASLASGDEARLGVNIQRAARAAEAFHAGVAPFVSLSGGAVHSSAYEAFMLDQLVTCRFGVPADRVLLDPCADHTHTNVRNTGALVANIGGRFAYLVTDDGLQSGYLEEWTIFDLVLGSIDQRSLRDFGHLVGSWRRASVGMHAGFWFTPYRYWAEDPEGIGGFSCTADVPRDPR